MSELAWLAAFVAAAIAALGAMFLKGRASQRRNTQARDAAAYAAKRKEIDDADIGHGATDSERIVRLREIAERRRGASDN